MVCICWLAKYCEIFCLPHTPQGKLFHPGKLPKRTGVLVVPLKPPPGADDRNIVGRDMLCAFGHRVAMCCDVLRHVGVVGSFENGQI